VTKKSICELKNNLPGEVAANILEGWHHEMKGCS
jgi:hypothetical protein